MHGVFRWSGGALVALALALLAGVATLAAPGPRKLVVKARAYCLPGRTSQGTPVGHGTISVDPRVIPLGSRIYVPGYGYGRAVDHGSSIRGNQIDVWMPTAADCRRWGVRKVEIVVNPPAEQARAR